MHADLIDYDRYRLIAKGINLLNVFTAKLLQIRKKDERYVTLNYRLLPMLKLIIFVFGPKKSKI